MMGEDGSAQGSAGGCKGTLAKAEAGAFGGTCIEGNLYGLVFCTLYAEKVFDHKAKKVD